MTDLETALSMADEALESFERVYEKNPPYVEDWAILAVTLQVALSNLKKCVDAEHTTVKQTARALRIELLRWLGRNDEADLLEDAATQKKVDAAQQSTERLSREKWEVLAQHYRQSAKEDLSRRAPVQASSTSGWGKSTPPGTISWEEHLEAYKNYHYDQSASQIAERGGFGYAEITKLLGHEPTTWEPR